MIRYGCPGRYMALLPTSSGPHGTGLYVLVIAPLGGMLLVYRPETRGHIKWTAWHRAIWSISAPIYHVHVCKHG